MEYKLEVAQSMRAGLAALKEAYQAFFYKTSIFSEQWRYVQSKQIRGLDFDETMILQNTFARNSRALLRRIGGD